MTTGEFNNEFDIYYNSIASNSAPGLDLYEKSVYLTKAQLEIVKNHFNPRGNKYQVGFEGNSKRRVDLQNLITSGKSVNKITADGLNDNSTFFTIPNETYIIIQEECKVDSSNLCVNDKYLKVVPKTHDEYNTQINNPFKKPNNKLAWRIDNGLLNGVSNVEIISEYDLKEYKFKYIVYPSPIVLTNLTTLYPGEGLSIDGVTIEQTCKLNEGIHREILDRAVELALADYKPNSAALKAQMNLRNE